MDLKRMGARVDIADHERCMPSWKVNRPIQEFHATMSFAIDVNILLYASDTGSPHFERAKSFIESCIASERSSTLVGRR